MTTQVSIAGMDGGQRPITIRADQNSDNSVAFRSSIEFGGNPVGPANQLPVSMTPQPSVFSSQLEAAHILKAQPGTLYAFQASFIQSGWIMLFDVAATPADGLVVPRKVWQVSASENGTLDKVFSPPLAMQNGAVLVFSLTGPFQKTQAAQAQFSAEIA